LSAGSDVRGAIKALISHFGKTFSEELGINLNKGEEEVFKWFLASLLYGAPIGGNIVVRTYKEFEERGLITPEAIVNAGWDSLVDALDAGGYVRYDFKTATKILEACKNLLDRYGSLEILHDEASSPRDLEKRIKGLAKGIGDTTVELFLRELRGIWEKAEPFPGKLAVLAAINLGFTERDPSERGLILSDLKALWKKFGKGPFPVFEAALVRLGRDFCKKNKCSQCPMREFCRRR